MKSETRGQVVFVLLPSQEDETAACRDERLKIESILTLPP